MGEVSEAFPMPTRRTEAAAWKLTDAMTTYCTEQAQENSGRRLNGEEQSERNRQWQAITIGAYRDWFDECVAGLAVAIDHHDERLVSQLLHKLGRHGRVKKKSSARNQPKTACLRYHLGRTGGAIGQPLHNPAHRRAAKISNFGQLWNWA
jgi:hypothetical protein